MEVNTVPSLARSSLARFSTLSSHHASVVGRFSVTRSQIKIELAMRHYCTAKEEPKKPEEKVDSEIVDSDSPNSPFARRGAASPTNAPKQLSQEEEVIEKIEEPVQRPDDSEHTNSRVPPGKTFTPTFIITINTEKSFLRGMWRGLGLVSFNFMLAMRSWKTKPDGSPIPAFWQRQLNQARLDAIMLMLGICAISGADILLFTVWLTGVIFFPHNLLPSVMRTPTRGEVRAFVHDHLEDLDTEKTGYATISDAKRVLMVVEREMDPITMEMVFRASAADNGEVDYRKLADVVVGQNIGTQAPPAEEKPIEKDEQL